MEPVHSQQPPNPQELDWLATATELKQATLERLAAMPDSEREIVAPPVGWSAAGIVEHLILVEECVSGPWQESLKAAPKAKPGVKSEMVSRMVSFVFSKTGIQVPTVSELEPAGGIEIEEAKASLECGEEATD